MKKSLLVLGVFLASLFGGNIEVASATPNNTVNFPLGSSWTELGWYNTGVNSSIHCTGQLNRLLCESYLNNVYQGVTLNTYLPNGNRVVSFQNSNTGYNIYISGTFCGVTDPLEHSTQAYKVVCPNNTPLPYREGYIDINNSFVFMNSGALGSAASYFYFT